MDSRVQRVSVRFHDPAEQTVESPVGDTAKVAPERDAKALYWDDEQPAEFRWNGRECKAADSEIPSVASHDCPAVGNRHRLQLSGSCVRRFTSFRNPGLLEGAVEACSETASPALRWSNIRAGLSQPAGPNECFECSTGQRDMGEHGCRSGRVKPCKRTYVIRCGHQGKPTEGMGRSARMALPARRKPVVVEYLSEALGTDVGHRRRQLTNGVCELSQDSD